MTIVSDADNSLLRSLREIATRQKTSPALAAHLEHYFADADISGLGEIDPEALFGAAIQHHRLGLTRLPGQAAIAFYAPDFDRHGWHSPHTAIDIVTDDMPFLVDSITMLIYQQGLVVHRLMHPLLGVVREADGQWRRSAERGSAETQTESWIHLEIDRISDNAQIDALRREIVEVLADVRAAVEDHVPMLDRVAAAVAAIEPHHDVQCDDVVEFLRWIANDNFVFFGYAHFELDGRRRELKRTPGAGLGLLRDADHPRFGHSLDGIPSRLSEIEGLPSALTLVKADVRSTLHRAKYLDFVGVHYRNAEGKIVGAHVFIGLYAMHVYHISTNDIPVVRRKVAAVRAACGFAPLSHKDKTLVNVLETYPRDELIEMSTADLCRNAGSIVTLQEHPRVRVLMRTDSWGRYVSALVYMPRDRFDTTLRKRIIALLQETLHAESIDFYLMVGDSRLARLHLIARVPRDRACEYDANAIEHEVARIVRGWQDELQQNLVEHCGEARGNALLRRYARALPLAYQDQVPPTSAVSDLERLDAAERSGSVEVKLNAPYGDDGAHQHIKLFLNGLPRPLSAVLPVFENLGLTVLSEQPFRLSESDLHISDFAVQLPNAGALDDEATRQAFVGLLEKLLRDEAENDGFNRLALLAGLDDPRITILRAYGKYLRQAGLKYSQGYIERSLAAYPQVARRLVELFAARLEPQGDEAKAEALLAALDADLAGVGNLDDDQILSAYRAVVVATLRTNAWQTDADGHAKPYLSFKIDSRQLSFLPKPVPLYEIFVYSPRMEGIHLRGARVARGGMRWSDRMEDFRTEVLGLVKAQMVKNAVIVPLGSKGGFVCKRLPPASDREAYMAEGIACYSTLIRGMLDLTDNRADGKVIPPKNVRRRDGDDPYLVVAADKGTATFSDIANGIAIEYGFWLGDAFASGGSVGYDHKKMGITARGAWEAVKRHFRELGRDTQSEPFDVIGIGDMSGDVFGNGLLLSERARLVAAFDHRHIFLDPNPDPQTSFAERRRLFALPRSSWDDYDKSLISKGGGVWPRTLKSIPLSPEARARLGLEAEHLAPNELVSAILKAPADLLYNGGIGTYVKASTQSHAEANDRSNDALRVDASELRVKVIGEGGNLGMTQKARIEYALAGGQVYTDAIDNSAGVDCSDHEVNIKILLSGLTAAGDMTAKQRIALLAAMTDDVAHLVLRDNYQQTQAISLEAGRDVELLNVHAHLMRSLEAKGALSRAIEFLPDDKGLVERAQLHRGLTAPEISVLLAYAKIALKESILATELPDAEAFAELLEAYFPPALVSQCRAQLPGHPLKREIITTQLVNRLVNRMGTTFVMQMGDETGAEPAQVVAAWYAASTVLDAESIWGEIESLDLKIPAAQQLELMSRLRGTVSDATRQILASNLAGARIEDIIAAYREAVARAVSEARAGKAPGLDAVSAVLDARACLVAVFELVDLTRVVGRPIEEIAQACGRIESGLDLDWLGEAIGRLPAGNRWQARARARLAAELRTVKETLVGRGFAGTATPLEEGRKVVDELKRNAPQDLAMLSAGLSEVRRLLNA